MRYIPHTAEDVQEMLGASGLKSINDLLKSIPKEVQLNRGLNLPHPLSEPELLRHTKELGLKNATVDENISFLGAGSYRHHIPAAVHELATRSEWVTPYTPYQPEISQGTLQAMFEYQTMVCNLTGMEVANASHYDGATATAEAALLAIQKTKRNGIIAASTLHPEYKDTIKTLLKPRNKTLLDVPFEKDGRINLNLLKEMATSDMAGIIVQTPNFFGAIEDLEGVSKIAAASGALFIVTVTEPISLGILKPPGAFGADIVTAEGQALGCGLNYGGPYLGIFTTREKYLRAMPGRVVGQTVDKEGRRGFVLTMSTREQHIRRGKATSNICSNEALMATMTAIYLSLLGREGLKKLALICLSNAQYLKSELAKIKGLSIAFDAPVFNEFVIKVDKNVASLNKSLLGKKIYAGVPLECWYPTLKNHLLVCTTECHSKGDLDTYIDAMRNELK